jgi:SAM-dependent methyltransferase
MPETKNAYLSLHCQDLAKVSHWEEVWKRTRHVRGVSRFNYYDSRMAALLRSLVLPASRAVEIGCGGSRWIAFFDKVLGCETWGIDYSAEGLAITAQGNGGNSNVRLVEGDFFDRSLLPAGYFDFVFSGGFIEHFTDPTVVTRRFAEILAPGGKVLTLTPNFLGFYRWLQKAAAPDILAKHVRMDRHALDDAHHAVGLSSVMPAQFWGCFAPGVVNFGKATRLILPPIKLIQQTVCWSLHTVGLDQESHFSPYIAGAYQKTGNKEGA